MKTVVVGVLLMASQGVVLAQSDTVVVANVALNDANGLVVVGGGDRVVVDEVVAIVGNTGILMSDIENMSQRVLDQRKAQGTMSDRTEREEAFEILLTQHLMSTRAKLDSLDKEMMMDDSMVESEILRMVERAGSVAQLEKNEGKPIYQIKADITLDVKQMMLAQTMERNIRTNVKVDYQDVADFVNSIPDDEMQIIPVQYSFSQIVKIPPQTDERKYAIRERLLDYRKRILDGEITLGALAQLYSADLLSARRRGELGFAPLERYHAPFADAAEPLKIGEISEIVETENGFHLIELIAKNMSDQGVELYNLRHILLKPEFTVEEGKRVVEQLDSVRTVVLDKKLSFGEAALLYSDDVDSKENGGKVFNKMAYEQTWDIRAASTKFAAEELRADYREISALKVGEISQPYETMDMKGNIVKKIICLDAIIDPHKANVVDDYDLLEAVTLMDKQGKEIEKWIDREIERVYIQIKPEYQDYKFDHSGWVEAAKKTERGENLKVKLPDFDAMMEQAKVRAARNAAELAQTEAAAATEVAKAEEQQTKTETTQN